MSRTGDTRNKRGGGGGDDGDSKSITLAALKTGRGDYEESRVKNTEQKKDIQVSALYFSSIFSSQQITNNKYQQLRLKDKIGNGGGSGDGEQDCEKSTKIQSE